MPGSNSTSGNGFAATNLLVLVERAEDLRATVASDAAIARAAAKAFDEYRFGALTEVDLGSCCRLVHWALIESSNALEPLVDIAGSGTAITLDAYLATCEEQRQLLLWNVASVNAIRQLVSVFNAGNEGLLIQLSNLGGLCQSLQFSALALASLKQVARQVDRNRNSMITGRGRTS